jgi:class 3 adenylate cyclase
MSADAVIGLAAGFVAILGACLSYAHFLVKAPLESQIAKTEAERAQTDAARDDIERQLQREREHFSELDVRYRALQEDFAHFRRGKTSVPLKQEIESQLYEAMEVLGVKEGSILVPGPPPNSSHFVFLVVYGPAAAKLRLAKLPIDRGIVGRVFETGTPHSTANAHGDPNFFSGIDQKGAHRTQSMLTVPVNHHGQRVGVAQFLNKAGGFDASDERRAEEFADSLGGKLTAFVSDPSNFELLGIASQSEDRDATIAFCDLTSSSLLLEQMNVLTAIDCINEYLEQQCDMAMALGATVDKYLGDGVMLRFNVPREIIGEDHAIRAVEAALNMQDAFEMLKSGWLSQGLPVKEIFNRIGLASGTVYEAKIGHSQFQQITVIGDPVNTAASLCESAHRSGNVITASGDLVSRLDDQFAVRQTTKDGDALSSYEVLGLA